MIQKKKKQIKLAILVVIIVGLLAGGTVWFATSRNTNMQITANNDKIIQRDFSSKRLIVTTDIELKETFNSKSVNKLPSGKYVIKYETEEDTKNAYEKFVNNKAYNNCTYKKSKSFQNDSNISAFSSANSQNNCQYNNSNNVINDCR